MRMESPRRNTWCIAIPSFQIIHKSFTEICFFSTTHGAIITQKGGEDNEAKSEHPGSGRSHLRRRRISRQRTLRGALREQGFFFFIDIDRNLHLSTTDGAPDWLQKSCKKNKKTLDRGRYYAIIMKLIARCCYSSVGRARHRSEERRVGEKCTSQR